MTTTMATCTGPGSRLIKSDSGQSFLRTECSMCRKHHPPASAEQRASATLEQQVRNELSKTGNERVVAVVASDGGVRSYLAHRPYTPPSAPLTAQEKFALSRRYGTK